MRLFCDVGNGPLVSLCQPATGKDATIHLPYAGSGASVFHNWFLPLYDSVDLYALQLPGRESRAAEAPYRDMEEAGGAIADCLANLFDDDVPYVFFGHSMGALLAYRVACVLRARGRTEPCRLVLSGMAPPHLGQAVQPLHRLPANQAITLLGRMGGVPDIVLASPTSWRCSCRSSRRISSWSTPMAAGSRSRWTAR